MKARLTAVGVLALLAVLSVHGRALPGRRTTQPERGPDDHAVVDHEIQLAPLVVYPMAAGPTIPPLRGLPRTPGTIVTALRAIRPALVDCYRWARFRHPALGSVPLHVAMRLDQEGVPSSVALEPSEPAQDGGLRACLREMLGTLSVGLYTPRVTDVTFVLHLGPSGQGRPAHAPARPRRAARATVDPARGCGAGAPPVMDLLDLEAQDVDDFSEEQARQERREKVRREHRDWIRGGKVGPEPVEVPDVIAGCANVRGAFTAAALTRALVANVGAYGACFAAAEPEGNGQPPARVDVAVEVHGDGRFCSARVTSQVDARLARCLEAAVDDVWLPAAVGGRPVRAIVPLVRGTAALATSAPGGPGCAPKLAELQRRLDASPWLTDPGLFALAEAIGAETAHAPPTVDRDGCWKRTRKLMTGAVIELHKSAQVLLNPDVWEAAIGGYDWLLAQRPPLPDQVALRFYRAEALWIVRRWTDAARAYADVREREPQGRFAKDAAYAAVLAWRNAIDDGDEESCCAPARPGRRPPPSEPAKTGFVSAIDAYLRLVPDSPQAEELIKRKAELLAR